MNSLIKFLAQTTLPEQQQADIPCRLISCDLAELLGKAADFMIALSGTFFFFMMLWGGIQYLTGAGDPNLTGNAKNTMVNAGIGLLIVIGSYALITFVFKGFTGGS